MALRARLKPNVKISGVRTSGRIGSEGGESARDTGPQKLAVTSQARPGLPTSGGGSSRTSLISGIRRNNGSKF